MSCIQPLMPKYLLFTRSVFIKYYDNKRQPENYRIGMKLKSLTSYSDYIMLVIPESTEVGVVNLGAIIEIKKALV